MLCTKPVAERIKETFQFQTSLLGSPIPTFGDVPNTFPPGFVFDMGIIVGLDGNPAPIRFLHFEPHRIVIDAVGRSPVLDLIYEKVREVVAELRLADDTPVIGEPAAILDYSEITAQWPAPWEALVPRALRRVLANTPGLSSEREGTTVIPALSMQVQSANEPVSLGAGQPNNSRSFKLELRNGTTPAERTCFSSAPLDTEAHTAYLTKVAEALAS
jgi:hypothetical protein